MLSPYLKRPLRSLQQALDDRRRNEKPDRGGLAVVDADPFVTLDGRFLSARDFFGKHAEDTTSGTKLRRRG